MRHKQPGKEVAVNADTLNCDPLLSVTKAPRLLIQAYEIRIHTVICRYDRRGVELFFLASD